MAYGLGGLLFLPPVFAQSGPVHTQADSRSEPLAARLSASSAAAFVEVWREGNLVAYKWQPVELVAPIVRVRAQVPDLSPQQLFSVAWDVRSQAGWVPLIKHLQVLSATASEVVVYEQVAVPVVRDRDYVLRLYVAAQGDSPAGLYRIVATPAPIGLRPVDGQHVRMTDLWSTWTFQPRPGGGSEVVYEAYGDPAGSLPAWLKKSAALRGPVAFVKALLAETRRRVGR